jgi:hemoglobin/transferrin/lactoferrin receptor protein
MKLTRSIRFTLYLTLLAPLAYGQSTPSATSPNTTTSTTAQAPATSPQKGKTTNTPPAPTTPSHADNSKKLGEIVVVATRTPQEKSKVAASVSTYSAQNILNNNISSPQELIQDDVGVSASRSVGGGGDTLRTATGVEDYNIRGLDENRVLLIEDGIRAPDIFSFQGNVADGRDFYDFDSLKSVEIVKSSASTLYGGGAIGGVVSYATKDPSDFLSLTNNPYYFGYKEAFDSSDFSFAETATFAARTGPVDYLLLYTRRDGQQQDISASTSTYGPAGANPLDYYQNNFLGKLVYHLDEQNQLRLTGEYYNYHGDSDLKSAASTSFDFGFGPIPFDSGILTNDEEDRNRVSLDYQFNGKKNVDLFKNIQAQVYYQETNARQKSIESQNANPNFFGPFPGIGAPGDPDVINRNEDYKTRILGLNLQATQDADFLFSSHEWTYGLDASYSTQRRNLDGEAIDSLTGDVVPTDGTQVYPLAEIPPSDTTRVGAFAQDQIRPQDLNWLTLTPALRLDYYDLSITNSSEYLTASNGVPGVSYSAFSATPSFSALAQATKELAVYGNFAEGYRNPNTEDLNATFTNPGNFYEVIPNPSLKSEQSYDFELGVRGNYEPVKFSLAGFYNIYNNFINQQAATGQTDPANGFAIYQSQNIANAEIHGVEGSVELPLGYYEPSLEGLKILSAFAYTEGNDLDTHQPLTTIDPLKIVNTLRYEAPGRKWGVDLVGTWVNSQGRVPSGTTYFVPPAYYTLDLVGRYRFNENALLTVGVYNLTNQTYWLYQDTAASPEANGGLVAGGVARFSEPGINVRAGLTVHF